MLVMLDLFVRIGHLAEDLRGPPRGTRAIIGVQGAHGLAQVGLVAVLRGEGYAFAAVGLLTLAGT